MTTPVFWIALAALQLEAAEVTPAVAARAVQAIPANLSRWREEATAEDFTARRLHPEVSNAAEVARTLYPPEPE
jgi:hypothetical protein